MNIDEIVKKLNEAREHYYNDEPLISDKEFDSLEDKLRETAPEHVYFDKVGTPVTYGRKIKHDIPMLSMGKAKTFEDIIKWIKRLALKEKIFFEVEPKIDGLSCDLKYIDGKLVHVATRGDGLTGQDITHIAKYTDDIPPQIKYSGVVHIRGEIYLPGNTKFPNPENKPLRNLAVGLINRKDRKLKDLRYLRFAAYKLIGNFEADKESERLEILREMMPNVVESLRTSLPDDLESYYNLYLNEYRDKWDYQTDGLTVVIDDMKLHEEINSRWVVDHHHHYQIAWKPPSESRETILTDIEWNLSRHGNLIPVAIFKPVIIGGAKIERAALNNFENIEKLALAIGDTLLVERANDVIPYIAGSSKNSDSSGEYVCPTNCPSCVQKLDREGVHLRCRNPECPEQQIQKIIFWASQCDIEGVSEQTVKKLWNENLVRKVADLYSLAEDQLKDLEGFGARSASKMVSAINKSAKMTVHEFIGRLGIESVGERALKKLNINSVQDFIEFNDSDFVTGQKVIDWKNYNDNFELFKELLSVIEVEEILITESKGKVCMTGKGSMGRKELVEEIKRKGYEFADTVTKDTDILICEDPESGSSKLQKASKLGVKLVSYKDFFKEEDSE